MKRKNNNQLIVKVLLVGAVTAVLSYLFHPNAGQLSILFNGEPVAEPLVRFAAGPTFLLIMVITGALTVLLFLGVGFFLFLFFMFAALMVIFIMAPYFWPVLAIILLAIMLMMVGRGKE
ncbi:hypothetical protein [Candidatus Methylobacter oryzae]|uniref:Uncharacterized protein n=1 Tax=Candidatus Methylobacter oryzae TaxID=2497749 RepID=A0ABY3C5K6_9GAMM|nr:hypothetical protein [Candidatus Methylobacter oryzae]TRW89958.1 hypothetical protein EKO24_020260 [Candidatus Methylobacter oryzae]